jgi:hypothetical protein
VLEYAHILLFWILGHPTFANHIDNHKVIALAAESKD